MSARLTRVVQPLLLLYLILLSPTGHAATLNIATIMLVPKTSMHENQFSSTAKHQIRTPWQIFGVQVVPITDAVNKSTDLNLRLGVLRADSRHLLRAIKWHPESDSRNSIDANQGPPISDFHNSFTRQEWTTIE